MLYTNQKFFKFAGLNRLILPDNWMILFCNFYAHDMSTKNIAEHCN